MWNMADAVTRYMPRSRTREKNNNKQKYSDTRMSFHTTPNRARERDIFSTNRHSVACHFAFSRHIKQLLLLLHLDSDRSLDSCVEKAGKDIKPLLLSSEILIRIVLSLSLSLSLYLSPSLSLLLHKPSQYTIYLQSTRKRGKKPSHIHQCHLSFFVF